MKYIKKSIRRKLEKIRKRKKTLVFILVVLIIVFSAINIINFENTYKDRFYPKVVVGDMSLGGQTYDEALKYFKEKKEHLEKNGLSINIKGAKTQKEINVPLSLTGLSPDTIVTYFSLDEMETTLQNAYDFGRRGNILQKWSDRGSLLFRTKKFLFSTYVHEEAINSLLQGELYNVFQTSVPASFTWNAGKVLISEEKQGESIDVQNIIENIKENLAYLITDTINLETSIENPTITKEQLGPFTDVAKNIAKNVNVIFHYKTRTWKIQGKKLIEWLVVENESELRINTQKVESYISKNIATVLDNPPRNSRFEIRKGILVETIAGKVGNVVDVKNTVEELEKIINTKESYEKNSVINLNVQTIEVEPKVTKETIEKYGIRDLVGKTSTSFKGSSADRAHNIKIGTSMINGLLIAPGEEFSTVKAIGRVTAEEGYRKETVIKVDKTTKEFGGGLCQIATSLFRLALNAGLPITERMNHRFVVSYYGRPGLDATIYGPHPDFRFVNDTAGYILLQGKVEGEQVILELYGQKDSRKARVSESVLSDTISHPSTKYIPTASLFIGQKKCIESPHDGVTANVTYTVDYPDGTKKEQNFESIYKPWQEICLIGTMPYPVTPIYTPVF